MSVAGSRRVWFVVLVLGAGLGCTMSVEEAVGRVRSAIEASPQAFSERLEESLDPSSRFLLRQVSNHGWLPEVLESLRAVLSSMRPVADEPGLLRGDEPSKTLFFLRDGWDMHLNLSLSGAWFAGLHALQYPRPW